MNRTLMINWIEAGTVSIPSRLLQDYKKLALSESEVMLLLHVHSFLEKGISFPTPELLSERMNYSNNQCSEMLRHLMKRGFLDLKEQQGENNYSEEFSLTPLWDKLIALSFSEKEKVVEVNKQLDEKVIYELFETEFARPLSPMELELITMWLDQEKYSSDLIKAALLEGVISGKLNLRYIDRILIEWSKNGVKTVQQAKDYGEKWRSHQYKQAQTKTGEANRKKIPSYDWLRS